jgi:LysM repeat protein
MYENCDSDCFEYVIQADDTILELAEAYGVAEEEIVDANPEVDFNSLEVGQVINIPEAELQEEQQRRTRRPGYDYRRPGYDYRRPGYDYRYDSRRRRYPTSCPRGREYYVRPGDTLYRIARRFNIPVQTLMARNRHIVLPLRVGDVICLPY